MQTSPQTHKGYTVFWLLGLLTVVLSGTTVFAMVRARADVNAVEHSHRILTAVQTLKASVTQSESSVRAYFVTGDETFLNEFLQRRPQAEGDAARLKALLSGYNDQSSRMANLFDAIQQRMSFLSQVAHARKAGESTASINGRTGDSGRVLSNTIGQLADEIGAQEERNLADRTSQRRATQIAMLTLCGVGLITSVGLIWVGQGAIRTYRGLRDQSEARLEELNAELEQKVNERTATLQNVNAELQGSKRELIQLVDALRRSNIELEKFAYAAGHDLQEPIRNVKIFAELLRKEYGETLPDEGNSYLQTIIDSSARMSELVLALLDYARLNLDSPERSEPVRLQDLLAVVETNLRAQIQACEAHISYRNLPVLSGSRLELLRLMQNLIGNSLKYRSNDRPCRIDIHAERDGLYWLISVVDNGIGFNTEYREYIFGVLKRLDRNNAGAGFGLAICKNIVERHGGRIWAESEEGQGATFSFLWPA